MGRPGTARNSKGPGRPEIQTIRAFSGLGRAGPDGPNVHLYSEHCRRWASTTNQWQAQRISDGPATVSFVQAHIERSN
jgi:hypothetical protein